MHDEPSEPIILASAQGWPLASGPMNTDMLEVGVVIWWGDELAVAHAYRPARNKYLR